MFFGFYLPAGTMTREETGPPVPELARRMTLSSCELDPVRALATVLLRMPAAGLGLGDILDDSGYAHRDAEAWAIPLRPAGAQLAQDLHPHDRGPRGTRRTGSERTFSTIKDPATTSIARGWCQLMGVTPLALWLACLLAVRNQRIPDAFDARQEQNARRAAAGLPPKPASGAARPSPP
jgi:hypothetical protein